MKNPEQNLPPSQDPTPSFRKALVRFADELGRAIETNPALCDALSDLANSWGNRITNYARHPSSPTLSEENEVDDYIEDDEEDFVEEDFVKEEDGSEDGEEENFQEEIHKQEGAPSPLSYAADLSSFVQDFSSRSLFDTASPSSESRAGRPALRRLKEIADACLLKARVCHLIHESAESPSPIPPGELRFTQSGKEFIKEAKQLKGCYHWMFFKASNTSPQGWKNLEKAYQNLAKIITVTEEILDRKDESDRVKESTLRSTLALFSEAQCMLRCAVMECCADKQMLDQEQKDAFQWLCDQCLKQEIYIRSYMKMDDYADPDQWEDLTNRIENYSQEQTESLDLQKKKKALFGTIRWEATLLPREIMGSTGADDRIRKITEACDDLIDIGVQPSNTNFRKILLPVMDWIEESTGTPSFGFDLVMQGIEDFLRLQDASSPSQGVLETQEGEAPKVMKVREWLHEKSIVLIGGNERPLVTDRLKRDFGLDKLYWISTRQHESNDIFYSVIAREEVALILLAIRWSSHSYGGIREYCDNLGKPLVRLPAGYGSNRVAHEIISQASDAFDLQ